MTQRHIRRFASADAGLEVEVCGLRSLTALEVTARREAAYAVRESADELDAADTVHLRRYGGLLNTLPSVGEAQTMTVLTRRKPVILRVWGYSAADLQRAETNARQGRFSGSWDIVEVIPTTGTPCPIPSRDPIAVKQNALYDAAWAAYTAERP